jgi:mannosyltransferase
MLVTLSSIFFVRSVKRGTLANCTGYVLSGASSSYVHLFGILILPAQYASTFLFRPCRRTANRIQISAVAIAILSVPAFLLAISGDGGQVDWIPRTSLSSLVQLFFELAGASRDIVPGSAALRFKASRDGLSLSLLLLYLAVIGVALIRSRSQKNRAAIYLLLSLIIPICLTVTVSFFKPLFVPRYLMITLPFFVTMAAIGISWIPWRAGAVSIAIAIVVLSLTQDYSYYMIPSFQDWRGAVRLVAEQAKPNDVLMVYPDYNNVPVQYHVARLDRSTDFPRSILMQAELPDAKRPNWLDRKISNNRLKELTVQPGSQIWFVSSLYDSSDERLLNALQSDYQIADQPNIPGLRLLLLTSKRNNLR